MQRETWRLLISSKRFYVGTFRFAESALILSFVVNVLLGGALFYAYLKVPARHFYATNGEVPPTELTAMTAPNETSVALLPADPDVDDDATEKLIPK